MSFRWSALEVIRSAASFRKRRRRADRNEGSFKINTSTGKWADFAAGVKGGDPVSLAAYLFDLKQAEAPRKLTAMLGLGDGPHG